MIDGYSEEEKARKDEEAQAEEDPQENEAQEINILALSLANQSFLYYLGMNFLDFIPGSFP